jgi:hypothetical protein
MKLTWSRWRRDLVAGLIGAAIAFLGCTIYDTWKQKTELDSQHEMLTQEFNRIRRNFEEQKATLKMWEQQEKAYREQAEAIKNSLKQNRLSDASPEPTK